MTSFESSCQPSAIVEGGIVADSVAASFFLEGLAKAEVTPLLVVAG